MLKEHYSRADVAQAKDILALNRCVCVVRFCFLTHVHAHIEKLIRGETEIRAKSPLRLPQHLQIVLLTSLYNRVGGDTHESSVDKSGSTNFVPSGALDSGSVLQSVKQSHSTMSRILEPVQEKVCVSFRKRDRKMSLLMQYFDVFIVLCAGTTFEQLSVAYPARR